MSTHRISWEKNKNKKQCLIFTPCKAQERELFYGNSGLPWLSHWGSLISVKHLFRGFTLHKMRGPIRGNLVPGKAIDRCKFKMGCGKFALIIIIIIIIRAYYYYYYYHY